MKRKWQDPEAENTKSPADIELHLETPLPLEWQRCLDIQSGQIHFYNTKTQKRTSMDPRRKPELPSSPGDDPLSLDLELNLNCQSIRKDCVEKEIGRPSKKKRSEGGLEAAGVTYGSGRASIHGHGRPSWLRLEREQQEMVARVCMQCHLLVMLLKSSPTCPNCKFLHPTDLQSPPTPTLFIASHPTKNQSQCFKSFPNPIQNKV